MGDNLEKVCDNMRAAIRDQGTFVRNLLNNVEFDGEEDFAGQHSEAKANIMLAFRHLEDARMRLGKVMQQLQGGVSILDRK